MNAQAQWADKPLPRPSVPRKGHVVARVAREIGDPVRDAVDELAEAFEQIQNIPQFSQYDLSASGGRRASELAAWHVITRWLIAANLGAIERDSSLQCGVAWFADGLNGVEVEGYRLSELSRRRLSEVATDDRLGDLLPYVLDPYGEGTRLSVRRDPNTAKTRDSRKASGVFYTPSDVADHMVHLAFENLIPSHPRTCLDLACGTGVFLRSAMSVLSDTHPASDPVNLAVGSLFGVDIDPWAVNATAYVLLYDIMSKQPIDAPDQAWQLLRANFKVCDALLLDPGERATGPGRLAFEDLFPKLKGGARLIVGNPPYAPLGNRVDAISLLQTFSTMPKASQSLDIHGLFVEQMVRLSASTSSGAMVIPLSVAFNNRPQFRAMRQLIEKTPGEWRFSFFDREPHALFGEDVKTRNTIVAWSRSPESVSAKILSGPLQKWRGRGRSELFRSIQYTEVPPSIAAGIPKVAADWQVQLLSAFQGDHCLTRGSAPISSIELAEIFEDKTPSVYVAGTAYNFINTLMSPPCADRPDGALSTNRLTRVTFENFDDALAAYALLSSRVAFVMWYILGDGFHVTRSFVDTMIGELASSLEAVIPELSKLGRDLWGRSQSNVIVSRNAGRASLAYPHRNCSTVWQIDELVLRALTDGAISVEQVDTFVENVVQATVCRSSTKA